MIHGRELLNVFWTFNGMWVWVWIYLKCRAEKLKYVSLLLHLTVMLLSPFNLGNGQIGQCWKASFLIETEKSKKWNTGTEWTPKEMPLVETCSGLYNLLGRDHVGRLSGMKCFCYYYFLLEFILFIKQLSQFSWLCPWLYIRQCAHMYLS
jgi:hypothetical protein